jgi:hypothetical protein
MEPIDVNERHAWASGGDRKTAPVKPVRLEIAQRASAFDGQTFGDAGPYEWLRGRVLGEVDPGHPGNVGIALLELAPRNAKGYVEYWSDFVILKPVQMSSANRVLLYDVLNRGEQKALTAFNDVPRSTSLLGPDSAGNGFLMRRGYTMAWSGWQGDIRTGAELLCTGFPIVQPKGKPFVGYSREEFVFDSLQNPIIGNLTYPAHTLDPNKVVVTVRRNNGEVPQRLDPANWRFVSQRQIEIRVPEGFDGGSIFEFVYPARDPVVLGLGFAAIRDFVSFLRCAGADNPLRGAAGVPVIDHVLGFGTSQSGRVLRDFLWQDFNRDVTGQRVFDGLFIDAAGSRKSFVNVPFGQPGRFSRQHEDHSYPGDQFPFTYADRPDTSSGRVDGILRASTASQTCPKVVHTDSSSEYWQARAALVTSDEDGTAIDIPESVRVYLYASVQHGGPAARATPICHYPINPLNDTPLHRALLVALEEWVTRNVAPPDSRIPRVADGTLVPISRVVQAFPAIPDCSVPRSGNELTAWDYSTLPPRETGGRRYVPLVPSTDADGNDLAGIRLPAISVPIGTYTGWNIRRDGYAPGQLASVRGSFFPFSATRADRQAKGDPRPSIEERYPSRDAYVYAVSDATAALCADRLLLEEDAVRLIAEARQSPHPFPGEF